MKNKYIWAKKGLLAHTYIFCLKKNKHEFSTAFDYILSFPPQNDMQVANEQQFVKVFRIKFKSFCFSHLLFTERRPSKAEFESPSFITQTNVLFFQRHRISTASPTKKLPSFTRRKKKNKEEKATTGGTYETAYQYYRV